MAIREDDFIIYEIEFNNEFPTNKIRWITGFKNKIEFDGTNFKEHAQIRRWCFDNCNDKVVFIENRDYGSIRQITMYFYDEKDAVACKLRWT